jgi:hypothetical protein
VGKHCSNSQYFKGKKLQSKIFSQLNIKKVKVKLKNIILGEKMKKKKKKKEKKRKGEKKNKVIKNEKVIKKRKKKREKKYKKKQ